MSGFRKLALVFAVLFAAFVAGRATAQDAPDIAGTVDLALIKYGYWFLTDRHHVVARGPELDLATPHGREALPGRGVIERTVQA